MRIVSGLCGLAAQAHSASAGRERQGYSRVRQLAGQHEFVVGRKHARQCGLRCAWESQPWCRATMAWWRRPGVTLILA